MGDFTGFTFGDWHSSDPQTGDIVVRVSGGDRYEEQLHPEIKDITAEVPGRDGEYYFGSNYGPKTIDIEIAFDHLTEEQFRRLRQVFGTKRIKELIFDERPYKKYMAKIESPVELSYICFDEPKRDIGTQRDGIRVVNRIERLSANVVGQTFREIDVGVNPEIFLSKINTIGDYQFIYNQENDSWLYNEEEVELSEYGIVMATVSDSPIILDGDYFVIKVFVSKIDLDYEQVTPYVYDYSKMERIYKGEGKISFKCYFPFAKSVFKQLPFTYQLTQDEDIIEGKKYFILENTTYSVVTEPNVADIGEYYERVVLEESEAWAISSGILSIDEYEINNIDKYDGETGTINIYNPGDIDTGFRLYLPKLAAEAGVSLTYKADGIHETASLIINPITLKDESEMGVLIDTTNEIIAGVSQVTMDSIFTTSGNIYNEYVGAGYFFKFEPNFDKETYSILEVDGGDNIEIFYNYLYF